MKFQPPRPQKKSFKKKQMDPYGTLLEEFF